MVLEYDITSKDLYQSVPKDKFKEAKDNSLINRGKVAVAGKLYSLLYYVDSQDQDLELKDRIKYVSIEMKNLLARASGIDAVADTLGDYIFEDSSAAYPVRHIFAFATLKLCVKEYFLMSNAARNQHMRYVLTSKDKGYNLLAILTPLASLPNFADCITEYSRDVDTGVDFVLPDTDANTSKSDWELYFGTTVMSSIKVVFNPDEWKVLAFLIVYCFNKTGEPNNLMNAIMKRLSAIKNAGHLQFDPKDLMEKIDLTSLIGLSAYMQDYPKLKSTIFSFLLGNSDPVGMHLAMVLKNANLSAFSAVVAFLGADQLTRLHFDQLIMREWQAFIVKKEKLVREYGENGLYYHKLICPDDQTAMTTDIPMLTAAARLWCKNNGMSSLANLKIKQDQYPKHFDTKVTEIVPLKFQAKALDQAQFKQLVTDCKLKLANLSNQDWVDLFDYATKQ